MLQFRTTCLCVLLLAAALTVAAAEAVIPPQAAPMIDSCRQDLATRLKVSPAQVTLEEITPVTWQNSALGLPMPGMFYAMALVPGYKVVLHTPKGSYYYHLGQKGFKYAGPVDLWGASALYVEPIENEPNLNGTLMQVSLLGTNPYPLATGVSEFFPQATGQILATRRTSRSGFELLLLNPSNEATVLASAFDFADPVLAPQTGQYAVFFRAMLSRYWQVEIGSLNFPAQPNLPMVPSVTALPDLPVQGQPHKLVWEENSPLEAIISTDEGLKGFKLVDNNGTKSWEAVFLQPETPGKFSLMLNKSYSLVVETATTAGTTGHPVTRVYQENFLGDQTDITTLDNFSMTQVEVTPNLQFALIVGNVVTTSQGVVYFTGKAYTVGLYTGEVFETIPSRPGPVHLSALSAHQEATVGASGAGAQ